MRLSFVFIIAIFITINNSAFAEKKLVLTDNPKVYFSLDNVFIDGDIIYLNDDSALYILNGFNKDQNGWYFLVSGIKWICPICQTINKIKYRYCQKSYCPGVSPFSDKYAIK
jgi:hypothetical protein